MVSIPIRALLAGALLLGGCDLNLGGGGSSSETETTLAGEIRNADDLPAVGARVSLMASDFLGDSSGSGLMPAEAVTDGQGRFVFPRLQPGHYSLEARGVAADTALATRGRFEAAGNPARLNLAPMRLAACSTLTGTVSPLPGSPAAEVFVFGTRLSAATGPAGDFTLENLPPGLQALRIVPADPALGALELAFRAGRPLGSLTLGPSDVLRVADFDQGLVETAFSAVRPKGAWYAEDDGKDSNPDTYRPSNLKTNFTAAYTDSADSGAWRGKSLHVEFLLQGTPAASYASVAFALGGARPGGDFSALDSVVFMAKGRGRIRFEFQTQAVIAKYKDWRHFDATLDLSSDWTRVALPIAQLTLSAGSPALRDGLTWEAAGKQVVNVVFLADEPADFWLDDLEFHGMSLRGL